MSQRAQISLRAVLQRINRRLAADHQALKVARPNTRREQNVGRYYVINRNSVVACHVDPEAYGRELGVVTEWEEVEAA